MGFCIKATPSNIKFWSRYPLTIIINYKNSQLTKTHIYLRRLFSRLVKCIGVSNRFAFGQLLLELIGDGEGVFHLVLGWFSMTGDCFVVLGGLLVAMVDMMVVLCCGGEVPYPQINLLS